MREMMKFAVEEKLYALCRELVSWPNGLTSLSPGHRPGLVPPIDRRPEGTRSLLAWSGAQPYRAPLARGIRMDMNPGRCPGLRNDAPLARTKS